MSFTKYYAGCVLPVHEIREPIEQQYSRIFIRSRYRLLPARANRLGIGKSFDECVRRPLKEVLQRIADRVKREIRRRDIVQKVKLVRHPCFK